MVRCLRSLVVVVTSVALAGVPVPASATEVRPVVSSHFSFTGFDQRVPAGSSVSVVQRCPAGTRLDASATRQLGAPFDAELQSTVRLVDRELWPAGLVSRYRVLQAADVPRDDGFGLINLAVCRGTVPVGATTYSARASTDVRVWGPAPAGVRLFGVTLAAVTDRPLPSDESGPGELPYRTAVRAAGVAASRGALSSGVRATQRAHDDDGSGSVLTEGTTLRPVPRGRFVSMRSDYAFTADLLRRIPAPQTSPDDEPAPDPG